MRREALAARAQVVLALQIASRELNSAHRKVVRPVVTTLAPVRCRRFREGRTPVMRQSIVICGMVAGSGHRGSPGRGPATATARPDAPERGCRRRRRRLGGSGAARTGGVVHVQRHRRQGDQGADLVAEGHLRQELHVRQGRRLRSRRARFGAPPVVGRAVVAPAGRQVRPPRAATRRSTCGATATSPEDSRCCRPARGK